MIDRKSIVSVFGVMALTATVACSGDKQAESPADTSTQTGAPTTTGTPAPQATGKTILVEMWTDGTGNYFKPNKIEAHQGDLVRFVLKAGVHNVHFLADSNKIKTGLPAASEMLQLPEQTYDLVVSMQEGEYYFQCDPHAALGMKGRLEVEDEE